MGCTSHNVQLTNTSSKNTGMELLHSEGATARLTTIPLRGLRLLKTFILILVLSFLNGANFNSNISFPH